MHFLPSVCSRDTLFAVGHVITLLSGVLMEINISAYIIDAIIGFSVVYLLLLRGTHHIDITEK